MKTFAITAALLVSTFAIGCSSTTTKDPGPGTSGTSGAPAPTGSATDAPPADGTTSGAPAPVVLKAPKIDMIMKMMGALHVTWTNAEASCDSVEGERQATMSDGSVMENYKVVFTVPGEADNKHDTTATDAMKYTYRLRCKKGTTYSPYSNEMSGTP
jgi:hypothetical protein